MPGHPGTASVKLSGSGVGRLTVEHHKSGFFWRVYQMAISCVPVGNMTLTGTMNGLPMMSPTTVLSGTAADGDPPIDIGDHDAFYIDIADGPANAAVILSYFYDELASS